MAWGTAFALRMQDPASGMIWEDVGGGGGARLSAAKWWYENHAGCGGDNSENRFTDNARGTGDERRVRQQYNPIVQYTLVSVLLHAAGVARGLGPRPRRALPRGGATGPGPSCAAGRPTPSTAGPR